MTDDAKKIRRDIDTLRDSIRIDWQELDLKALTAKEREDIRHHAKWAAHELNGLVLKLDIIERVGSDD